MAWCSSVILGSCLLFPHTRLEDAGLGVQMWLACLVAPVQVWAWSVSAGLSDTGVWPVSSFAVGVASCALSPGGLSDLAGTVSFLRSFFVGWPGAPGALLAVLVLALGLGLHSWLT